MILICQLNTQSGALVLDVDEGRAGDELGCGERD
jgi:hypothetical protein